MTCQTTRQYRPLMQGLLARKSEKRARVTTIHARAPAVAIVRYSGDQRITMHPRSQWKSGVNDSAMEVGPTARRQLDRTAAEKTTVGWGCAVYLLHDSPRRGASWESLSLAGPNPEISRVFNSTPNFVFFAPWAPIVCECLRPRNCVRYTALRRRLHLRYTLYLFKSTVKYGPVW